MNSILIKEPREVKETQIIQVVTSAGAVHMLIHNKNCARCQSCRQRLPAQSMYYFEPYFKIDKPMRNGYICPACLVVELQGHDYQWNAAVGNIGVHWALSMPRISGDELAQAFEKDGERGMFLVAKGKDRF